MPFVKRGANIFCLVAIMIVLCSGMLVWGVLFAQDPANADKETYVFDYSKFFYRRNDTDVALYYDGEFDENIQIALIDETGATYLDRFGKEGVTGEAKVVLTRGEDDQYAAFTGEEIPLVKNTDLDVCIMPIGQRKIYDGSATLNALATFSQAGSPAVALHAGAYEVTLAYEEPLTVPYFIDKATVTATPVRYERRYLEAGSPEEIRISGFVPEEDIAFVREHLELHCSVASDSVPGEYPITLTYDYEGDDKDFTVELASSICRVQNGLLSGFVFHSADFVYDGKTHEIAVSYDKDRWTGVTVSYDLDGAKEIGKYRVTATVSKEYYDDLTLRADLTIRALVLETSSSTEYASIEGSETGFDPTVSMVLTAVQVDEENRAIKDALAEKDGYKLSVISAYDLVFSEYVGGELTLRMRPSKPTGSAGVILLQYRDGEVVTVDYTYENGCFVVVTDNFDGFMFVKKVHVTHTSVSEIIIAAAVGIVVLAVLFIILSSFKGIGKKRRRSRRRHAKWA